MITDTKYLGLQIDSQLKWDKHIDTIKTKANQSLGFIKYAKKYLPSDRPVGTGGGWGGFSPPNILQLFAL